MIKNKINIKSGGYLWMIRFCEYWSVSKKELLFKFIFMVEFLKYLWSYICWMYKYMKIYIMICVILI